LQLGHCICHHRMQPELPSSNPMLPSHPPNWPSSPWAPVSCWLAEFCALPFLLVGMENRTIQFAEALAFLDGLPVIKNGAPSKCLWKLLQPQNCQCLCRLQILHQSTASETCQNQAVQSWPCINMPYSSLSARHPTSQAACMKLHARQA
jgi:hypothetical protein